MISCRLFLIGFIFGSFYFSESKVTPFEACGGVTTACTIHEVRMTPCKTSRNRPCEVKRGKSATISFDYTPDFDASTAVGQVFSVYDDYEAPLVTMDTNACKFTTCPIVKSINQTYSYSLHLGSKYPTGPYLIKWVLRNADETKTSEQCCFTCRVRLAAN